MKRLMVILISMIHCLCSFAQRDLTASTITNKVYPPYKPGDRIEQRFTLHYNLSAVDIDPYFLENAAQMDTIRHYLANSPEIDSITVYAYASPEGPFQNNERLAKKRAEAAKRFILESAKRHIVINIIPVAEDWEGLHNEIKANYHLPDKDEIIRILEDRKISDDRREIEIKKHRESYRYILENHIPRLRKATWVCHWIVPKPDIKCCKPITVPLPAGQDKGLAPKMEHTLPGQSYSIPEQVRTPKYLFALKTNLLYDAVTALNAEIEVPIGRRFSVAIEDVFPWWSFGPNKKKYAFQIWEMGIEPRWWFKKAGKTDKLLGHFAGVYAMSGRYDIQNNTKLCYQGTFWSAGLTYGYSLPIGKSLYMELSLSLGYMNLDYSHYQPSLDYEHLFIDRYRTGTVTYFGPTKLKVTLGLPIKTPFRKKK